MKLYEIFLLFLFYAIIGWCMEVAQSLIKHKKFVNRGFLIGPYCPIYGYGAVAITLLLEKYLYDPLVLFIMAIIICSVLEYFTSYFMEKIFKARWWDYTNRKFNINGRICLETMIPFGVLGTLISYFINPILFNIFNKIPSNTLGMISFVIFIILLIDNIISFTIISNIKNLCDNIKGDSTETVTAEVHKILKERKTILYNRIVNAFPSYKVVGKRWKK